MLLAVAPRVLKNQPTLSRAADHQVFIFYLVDGGDIFSK